MALFLIANIRDYPFKISRAERDDSVPTLPLQSLTKFVRTGALHLSYPRIDLERRKERGGEVNVIRYATDCMEVRARIPYNPILDKSIKIGFKRSRNKRKIILRMPRYMEIDLGVGAARHRFDKGVETP